MAATKRAEAALRTRAAVLAAAKTLFEHHGYEAVTLRQVAAEAGMSTGSIFAHVADKAELFEAATGHPAPDVVAFLRYVEEGKFDAEKGNDGAEAKLDEMACRAKELRHHIQGHDA